MRRLPSACGVVLTLVAVACPLDAGAQETAGRVTFRQERLSAGTLVHAFDDQQIAMLEKINRADRRHLERLGSVTVPDVWMADERSYSPLPLSYEAAREMPKVLAVSLAAQAFGAYEYGELVRWGPVSTGRRGSETPAGAYTLNWKSPGRHSTVNADWFMEWYFNFRNDAGLAFHAYALPGRPASHGCIRMLERDATWVFHWGEEWVLDANDRVSKDGTPVVLFGRYAFDAPAPWKVPASPGRAVELPRDPRAPW